MPRIGNYADKSVTKWTDIDTVQTRLVKEDFCTIWKWFGFGWF